MLKSSKMVDINLNISVITVIIMGKTQTYVCQVKYLRLPDLSSENTRHPAKFEFQIKNIFSIIMYHTMFGI